MTNAESREKRPALLTTDAVARELSVDPSTVRRWIDDGRLPACKPGRGYRVTRADLDEFLRVSTISQPLTLSPAGAR